MVDCRCKIFEAGGGDIRLQCSGVAITTPYDVDHMTWSGRNAFCRLSYVCGLHAFCHLIGAIGESRQLGSCTKRVYE